MWCTASFLHAAERTVSADGSIVPIGSADDPVFEFVPISVLCDEQFLTTWTPDNTSPDRFMLRIRNVEGYAKAMTKALSEVVSAISRFS